MSKRKKINSVEDAMTEIGKLQAENKELRSLWIENEGDIISLASNFARYLRLKWWQRLFVKADDPRLHKDKQS